MQAGTKRKASPKALPKPRRSDTSGAGLPGAALHSNRGAPSTSRQNSTPSQIVPSRGCAAVCGTAKPDWKGMPPTLLLLIAGGRLSAGHGGQYLPPAPIHLAPIHAATVHPALVQRAQIQQAIAHHPSYLFQPQRSSAQAYHASTPIQPGFLQACTWRQGTRQSPRGQEPPAPEPEPVPQAQKLQQPQRSSAATCLQMRRSAHRRRAHVQRKLSLNSLAPNPHVTAGHQGPGKTRQQMQRLGPGQT